MEFRIISPYSLCIVGVVSNPIVSLHHRGLLEFVLTLRFITKSWAL